RVAVQPERNYGSLARTRHLERILDAARLELRQHLLAAPRGRDRQIHPHSRPDLTLGDALPRIVAAAAQGARSMRGLRHIPEWPHADAAFDIGEEPGLVVRANAGAPTRPAARADESPGGAAPIACGHRLSGRG